MRHRAVLGLHGEVAARGVAGADPRYTGGMTEPSRSTRTDDLSVSTGPGPVASTTRGEERVAAPTRADEPVGKLVVDLTQQVSRLVREEVQLAKLDLTAKGKKAGVGLGMFSAAGLLAFFALGSLVTAAILAERGIGDAEDVHERAGESLLRWVERDLLR